jgi:DNA mismatch repair ATPase MutS
VTIVTAVLAFFRVLPWTAPGLSIVAGLLLLARYRSTLDASLTRAIARATGLRAQRQMLERLARARFDAPLLQREQQCAADGLAALSSLDRALSLLEGRGSLVHAIAAPILLWDLHAMAWLDRWRARHGPRLRACLDALGTIEALAALGTLAHDNPTWTFPELSGTADRLTATGLAHPLLPASIRVANDVTVGPPGTLLLVTGSNMSGKSTLLRAIGLNAVLAQAGAPVCASSLTMPLVDVRTSIRLADSLERGVSLFMAELERLKEIVDAARARDRSRPLLYLLDEILHGTNTAERLIAARAVLDHLVQAGAIGAVTTHDLSLAADGSLATASRPVHFTEQVGGSTNGDTGPGMTFDYRLRPGLATSTNALKLLALVGLAPNDLRGPPSESAPR